MTPDDDEALARLRAALHTIADRTPISGGRLDEVAVAATEKRTGPVVTIVSAAAAVAAIAAVTAVVANSRAGGLQPNRAGSGGPTATSAVASGPAPASEWELTPSSSSSATGPVGSALPSASFVADPCNPENYYVIATPAQLTGLTYLLPSVPAGYTLHGAWGTIARNDCAGSQTWYVEYDKSADSTTDVTISVRRSAPGAEQFPDGTDVTVLGHQARLLNKDATYGVLLWQAGGLDFQVSGPMAGGHAESLVALANSLIAVPVDDPRIVAPADCHVPPGSTCPSGSPALSPSPSPSPTPTPAVG
jgi:hypothetical protein